MSHLEQHLRPAILALADGTVFRGVAIGALGSAVGEVVFNTSMTGYQEILADPSYAKQIVTFTYPHIGNVGVNKDDMESNKAWAQGLVVSKLSPISSNWRSEKTLDLFLEEEGVVGIAEVDTRKLTTTLREKGTQSGAIVTDCDDPKIAVALAKEFPGLLGMDLAAVVTTENSYKLSSEGTVNKPKKDIVVYDFGVKQNILRSMAGRGCSLTIVPAKTEAAEVLAMNPDGVILSNGPGDPAACDYAIKNIKLLLEKNVPLFGICLGFQLLALACGAKTFKMKFGHHGANHPVQNLANKVVYVTSQNHGFAVEESSLPEELEITHKSLFDGTLQGIRHKTKLVMAFQGHPEASPGPNDICNLFDEFIGIINAKTW